MINPENRLIPSAKERTPMSENELVTLRALLNVSDGRISQNQKNALRHLIVQYEVAANRRLNEILNDFGEG